ncbi:MAG: GFA family protein [Gammaproteobacteria bacterium]
MKHQLAAILYADVAGYSRLTELDEEETLRKLDAGLNLLNDVIAAHGGQKINEAGDAILVEFQSAIASVHAAIEFQRQMSTRNSDLAEDARLEFRIGINLGEIMRDRSSIYGDGVNLAARIQGLAEPGEVCVSSTVYEQVAGKIDLAFDDLGYHKVKNISQPVHVYRAGHSDRPTGAEGQPYFDFDSNARDRSSLITGRCLCGDICYEISEPAIGSGFCHCRMCQRFSGAPVTAFVVFPREAVRFTKGEPTYYKSSLIYERGFCAKCGSSLIGHYYAPENSDWVGIKTASLDHPEEFAPTWHLGTESKMPWLEIHDNLPRVRCSDSPELQKRWEAVGVSTEV